MRSFTILAAVYSLLALFGPGAGAQEASKAAAPSALPILEVLAVAGRGVEWRPDWPAELPPDAFAVKSRKRVASISLTAESSDQAEEASSSAYLARWAASGALLERPYFFAGAVFILRFERDPSGRIVRFSTAEAPAEKNGAAEKDSGTGKETPGSGARKIVEQKNGAEKSGGKKSETSGVEPETVSLAYGSDGALSSAARKKDGTLQTSRFSAYGSGWEEIAYDEDGTAVGRIACFFIPAGLAEARLYAEDGAETSLIRFDYDSDDRITRVQTADSSIEALYAPSGSDGGSSARPLFTRLYAGKDAKPIERRFQWDERGLLVRETLVAADGKAEETSYSYSFDSFGEWTERRAFRQAEKFGIKAPEKGDRVLRKIVYRER